MKRYGPKLNPEDFFVKEAIAEYSTVLTEPITRYEEIIGVLSNYTFKDELEQIEIIHFICDNWFLALVLSEAFEMVKTVFGDDVTLVLELFIDPEDVDESVELFIVIRTRHELKVALEKLDILFDNWFVNKMEQNRGLLNVTIESKDEF